MLSERRVLKSIEVHFQTGIVGVLWSNQILRGDDVVHESNHRMTFTERDVHRFVEAVGSDVDVALVAQLAGWAKKGEV